MNSVDTNILQSDWLIHMLKKSSAKPSARLLSLFDILEDWLDAPVVNEQLRLREQLSQQTLDIRPTSNHLLQDYLTLEAAKAGAAMPEMLASQLYFMAIAAIQEKLSAQAETKAHQSSLMHAKNAAKALIAAQTTPEFRMSKTSVYAIAASFLGALVVAGSLFIHNQTSSTTTQYVAYVKPINVEYKKVAANTSQIASPEQTTALIAQIDQMRKGNCQLVEALQLPDSYKKVYFENIVSGQISTNVQEQQLVRKMLEMVRCNYTPMLMANSTN